MRYIYAGMTAYLKDGRTATVAGVLLDPETHERRYVVLAANGLFGPDVLVPFSAVWLIDENLHLDLTCAELAGLPAFLGQGVTAAIAPAPALGTYVQRHRMPGLISPRAVRR